MRKDLAEHSRFLSYMLRHKPESVSVELDENGWVEVSALLNACRASGMNISEVQLTEIVETNDKKRFAFSEAGTKIRASQGHSIASIDLQLKEVVPPSTLFHGTVEKFMSAIEKSGLQKMNRQHVHLSATVDTATNVGSRRGKPIILYINTVPMYKAGFKFYRSENGVWLTESVPWEYINHE